MKPNSDQQPSLFEPPPKTRRRHRQHRPTEASSLAYEKIKKGNRNKLYRPILIYLSNMSPVDHPSGCPTARDLLRALIKIGHLPEHAERNNVSPRLNELLQAGCIENPLNEDGSVYLKSVPGDATASTWRITAKGRELLEYWRQS